MFVFMVTGSSFRFRIGYLLLMPTFHKRHEHEFQIIGKSMMNWENGIKCLLVVKKERWFSMSNRTISRENAASASRPHLPFRHGFITSSPPSLDHTTPHVHNKISTLLVIYLQGDHSGCDKPPVNFKTKVPFQHEAHVLNRNLCFEVNGRFDTTWMVTLYSSRRLPSLGPLWVLLVRL